MLTVLMAAQAAERSTHDVVIAASAAIVGGLIGGSIPGYFMLKAEDKRHAHARAMAQQAREDESERERRAVIGAARALHEFFERVDMVCRVALETQMWWPDKLDTTLQPPSLDDQKAVLGQLTSLEAGVIASTMRAIELVRAKRDLEMEDEALRAEGLPRLRDGHPDDLKTGRTAAQGAARSLRRAADLPTPPQTAES